MGLVKVKLEISFAMPWTTESGWQYSKAKNVVFKEACFRSCTTRDSYHHNRCTLGACFQ